MKDNDLTPVENRDGLWYKREDLFSGPLGVNGSKYRAWDNYIRRLPEQGYESLVVGGSVKAPTVEKALKHPTVRVAREAGALITPIAVGYNPALQAAARRIADFEEGCWYLATPDPSEAPESDVREFMRPVADQTANLPDEVETLLLPFGSGITGASVLWGLHDNRPSNLKRVVLFEIGPDRKPWVRSRLARLGREMTPRGVELVAVPLHPLWAEYRDTMKETRDGIVFHPTYEGKVVRYLDACKSPWWVERDGKTAFWIVGGLIP